MANLSDIAKITITTDSVGVQQAGFGIPLILSPRPAWVERIRFYDSLTAVAADFATTTPEYKMAQKLFGQKIKPAKIAIGRAANKPTQKYSITLVGGPLNLTTYKVRVGGSTYSFTSDGSATNDEIIDGLAAAINAGSGDTTTATTPGGAGSHVLTLTANAAGDFDGVDVRECNGNLNLLSIVQDHAEPGGGGVAADLDAIKQANNSWYFVLYPFNSKACALAIAAWVEANDKLYIAETCDTNNVSLAEGSDPNTSLFKQLEASAFARTAAIYHPSSDAFLDAGWVGRVAPLNPGSETWKFKTIAGVTATVLTATEQTNANDKTGNHYQEIAGVNITAEGKVSAGEFIDVIRFRDWLRARLAETIFAHLAAAEKIPFTDDGIAVIEGDVRSVLREGIAAGGLAADPAPVVTVPKASAVSTANKNLRKLPDVKFTATLAGAIHLTELTGVISV